MRVYCRVMETFVEVSEGKCSLMLGDGDGSDTAPCPYMYTMNCKVKRRVKR